MKGAIILIISIIMLGCSNSHVEVIKIGVIAEMTGDIPAVGASCKNGAAMAVDAINREGGLEVSGKRYKVSLLIEDDAGRPEQAAAVAQKLIAQDRVLAIIGPNASSGAIPASEIAETSKVPLISPWSTNPKTTIDSRTGKFKRYAFRACYLDQFQGRVIANFAKEGLNAKKAAILYDVSSEVLKGQADYFKKRFEEAGGTIAAVETYTAGDRDFSAQLTKIGARFPEVIFLPSYYSDVPLQIQQAKRLGIKAEFIGSDAWASHDLINLCGEDCEGYYFSSHYSPDSSDKKIMDFVGAYKSAYGVIPDDVAALTYDATRLLLDAIKRAGKLNSEDIRNAIASTKDYKAITGGITFTQTSGDPIKGAVILQIKGGDFRWYKDVRP